MSTLICLFITLLSVAFACLAQIISFRPSPSSLQEVAELPRFAPPHISASSDKPADHDLLDVVLVASVDGKLHALNRTSGHTLWSMSSSSPIPPNSTVPQALAPLVRTGHVEYDPDLTDESDIQETYIIEPQSGAIFVMTNPSSPLRRFPFTMLELVEMSPFSFSGDEGKRVFVGRKETSLVLIELETGKVKATLNSECPWDPFEDLKEDVEVDLDELEGSKPQKLSPTEIFIGRTDYHISIITKNSRNHSPFRPPIQNLTFSVYGPNNQDQYLQSSYRRTKDDAYIQSLPNGNIISFVTTPNDALSRFLWSQTFNHPIVAIFDVLAKRSSSGSHPFLLEQPRPRLQGVPGVPTDGASSILPNAESAHVGMVSETGSLFAMSPERFPLVAFGNSDAQNRRFIEGTGPSRSHPVSPDDAGIPRQRPIIGNLNCRPDVIVDRRCLLGMRKVDEGDWPLKRLIEAGHGVPRVEAPVSMTPGSFYGDAGRNSGREIPDTLSPEEAGTDPSVQQTPFLQAVLIALVFGIVSAWMTWKRLQTKMTKGITAIDALDMAIAPEERSANLTAEYLSASSETSPNRIRRPAPLPIADLPTNSNTVLNGAPAIALVTPEVDDGDESDKDGEGEADAPATPGKKKVRRGKRGRKKKTGIANSSTDDGKKDNHGFEPVEPLTEKQIEEPVATVAVTQVVGASTTSSEIQVGPSLTVSDTVLGYGSHGTVVFQGSLQGRAVAVKRLLRDFVTLASREVSILQESDDHPNVIRYYYQEAHANFLYIALELCPASLADIIEYPDRDQWKDFAISFEPKRALKQIAGGLKHLHALKLVHRDIKPQNILVSSAKSGSGTKGGYRMLISDFGLCKKLDVDQTSFAPTAYGAMAAGTVGWRAPEILRGEVKLDEISDDNSSMSSRGSVATVVSHGGSASGSGNSHPSGKPRLTKSVDIFALGCLFYYVLTNGGHPYGDKYEREVNILKNAKNLEGLERFGEEGSEAVDLISQMLDPEASKRPDTTTCLLHPYFWDSGKRLNFLQDASDRFEIMCRDPKDPYLLELEKDAASILGNDWHLRLDKIFIENLGKFRKYDGRSVQDLLRALRNKKHHYQDIPDNVKRHLGSMPEGYLAYFTRRFPHLFLHVHAVIRTTSLRTESMFRSYFELPE